MSAYTRAYSSTSSFQRLSLALRFGVSACRVYKPRETALRIFFLFPHYSFSELDPLVPRGRYVSSWIELIYQSRHGSSLFRLYSIKISPVLNRFVVFSVTRLLIDDALVYLVALKGRHQLETCNLLFLNYHLRRRSCPRLMTPTNLYFVPSYKFCF